MQSEADNELSVLSVQNLIFHTAGVEICNLQTGKMYLLLNY